MSTEVLEQFIKEFKYLITSLRNWSEILQESVDQEEWQKAITQIYNIAEAMEERCNSIRTNQLISLQSPESKLTDLEETTGFSKIPLPPEKFLAQIAHELKHPINVFKNWAIILQQSQERKQVGVAIIAENAKALEESWISVSNYQKVWLKSEGSESENINDRSKLPEIPLSFTKILEQLSDKLDCPIWTILVESTILQDLNYQNEHQFAVVKILKNAEAMEKLLNSVSTYYNMWLTLGESIPEDQPSLSPETVLRQFMGALKQLITSIQDWSTVWQKSIDQKQKAEAVTQICNIAKNLRELRLSVNRTLNEWLE